MENINTATIAFTPAVSTELSAVSCYTQLGGRPFGVTRSRVMTADRLVTVPFHNSIGAATGAAKQGAPPRGVPR